MKTSAKSPKLTKARREYTCHRCRLPIARGESYRCQVVTCGSPGARTVEARGGFPTVPGLVLTDKASRLIVNLDRARVPNAPELADSELSQLHRRCFLGCLTHG
jgi:hypothetical protein